MASLTGIAAAKRWSLVNNELRAFQRLFCCCAEQPVHFGSSLSLSKAQKENHNAQTLPLSSEADCDAFLKSSTSFSIK